MVKCPFCGFEGGEEAFELLREPWKFRYYQVKKLKCPQCGKIFNYYKGVSPRTGKQSEFVIKVKPKK